MTETARDPASLEELLCTNELRQLSPSGVYWLNPPRGTLRHCPLTGCLAGGANTLASGRTAPKQLTLGAGFAYWIEGNTIIKVAKP